MGFGSIICYLSFLFLSCVYTTAPSLLSTTEGDSSITINQSINPISGDYVIAETDLIANGHEPIYLQRTYLSSIQEGKEAQWILFPHLYLYIDRSLDKKKQPSTITVTEPNGSKLHYKNTPKTPLVFLPVLGQLSKGITNTSKNEISAKTNLANYSITKDKSLGYYILKTADGTKRFYKKVSETDMAYLEKERKPNGNWICYKYNTDYYTLKEIFSTSPNGKKIYAKVTFNHEHPKPHYSKNFSLTSEKDDYLQYIFDIEEKKEKKQTEKFFRLASISSSSFSKEALVYKKVEETKTFLVTQRLLDNKVLANISYYAPGINQVLDQSVTIKKYDDPIERRIKTLEEPVGVNGSCIPTHRLFYNVGQYPKENGRRDFSHLSKPIGYTICYDVYDKKTVYAFNDFFVPLYTYKYGTDLARPKDGHSILLFQEHFLWVFDGSLNRLKAKIFADQNKVLSKKIFEYDSVGNVIKETLIGNLSGHNFHSISLNSEEEYYSDKFVIHSTYDLKNNSNLTSQTFSSGLSYAYLYIPDTNLQKAKFTLDHGIIKLREFYIYNEDNVLTETIFDNGNSFDVADLTHVTERKVKSITLSHDPFSLNLPYIIEEKGWDSKTNTYPLLNKKILSYSKQGLLIKEDLFDAQHSFVCSLHKDYDEKKRLIKSTDSLGRASLFSYDSLNNVIKETSPLSNSIIHSEKDLFGKTLSIKTNDNHATFFVYDLKQRLIQTKDHLGNITDYIYDDLDHEIEKILPARVDENGNVHRPSIKTLRDVYGNALQITDSLGRSTHYKYNIYNKPTEIIFPDNSKELFFYYIDGSLHKHINPAGIISEYLYDFLGREIKKEVFSKDRTFLYSTTNSYSGTHLISPTDGNNVKTLYGYDAFGRVISELKQKEGAWISREEYGYDSLGNLSKKTIQSEFPSQQTQVYLKKFDKGGRLIEEKEEDEHGTLFCRKTYEYDEYDHQISIIHHTEESSFKESFTYDNKHRVTSYTNREGKTSLKEYRDFLYNSKTKSFESEILSTSVDSSQLKEHFNSLNQLIYQEVLNSFGDVLSKKIFYYDLEGNVIKETYISYEDKKPLQSLVFTKKYDSFNRLVSLKEEPNKETQFFYDGSHNLSLVIQPDGSSLTYLYNDLLELVSLKSSDETIHYLFSYDSQGHVIEEQDLIHQTKTRRTYNIKGELVEETLANGLHLQKSYDSFGRKLSLLLPDRSSINYIYDAFHLKKVSRKTSSQKHYSHLYLDYNLEHQPKKESLIFEVSDLENTYDSLGRHISLASKHHSQHITSFEDSGSIKEILFNGPLGTLTQSYDYDDLNHLIKEEGFYHNCYGFDPHHNRQYKNNDTYQNDDAYKLLSDGAASYSYSETGCRSLKKTKSNSLTYHYDALQRLTCLKSESIEILFTYDSWHRRLSKTIKKKNFLGSWNIYDQEFYLYDDQKEIGAASPSLAIKELKILGVGKGADIGSAVAIEIEGKIFAPLHDLFGNIIALVEAEKNYIAESYLYTAFGESTLFDYYHFQIPTTTAGNKWRYQSKRIDEESGLILFGRRYYDPLVGRWLSKDPLGLSEGPNFYQFLYNNPLSNADLYGLSVINREELDTRPRTSINPIQPFTTQESPYATTPPWVTTPSPYYDAAVSEELKKPFYTPYGSSRIHPSSSHLSAENHRFIFINGINTSLSEACEMRNACSTHLGYNVDLFYNETQGTWKDLKNVSNHHKRIESAIITDLKDCLTHEASHGKNIFIFAHSGGGLITHNAIEQLSTDHQKKIHITTFGSAKYMPKWHENLVNNYVSKRDLIAISSNVWHGFTNINHPAMKNPLNANIPITYLEPHSILGFKEHAFMGVTYQKALRNQCDEIKSKFFTSP